MKRASKLIALGILSGLVVLGAYIVFVLPGGLPAFLQKRTDFSQLYVYNVGETFIDIGFHDLNGQEIRLSRYPHHVVLLNFFASWSEACGAQAPRLERISRRYHDRGLVVVGVDVNESGETAQVFRQNHHLTFPALLVADRVEGGFMVPFNLVIDQTGVVRFAGAGDRPHDIEDVIESLLGE